MSEPSSTDKKVIPIAVAAPEASVPESPTGAMIRTLGLVSAICGLIIVGAYQGTYDAVAANKRIATERAVFKVLPKAKSIARVRRRAGRRRGKSRRWRHGDPPER
jgi:hypothetical protein